VGGDRHNPRFAEVEPARLLTRQWGSSRNFLYPAAHRFSVSALFGKNSPFLGAIIALLPTGIGLWPFLRAS